MGLPSQIRYNDNEGKKGLPEQSKEISNMIVQILSDAGIIARDIIGLFSLTDPTLPVGHDELIPVIKVLAHIFDIIWTLSGR
jgi:hypothetical protein